MNDTSCTIPQPAQVPAGSLVDRMRKSLEQVAPEHEAIVARLCSCGYEAYITGGAVRDLLLGKDPLDFDVVTNARPDEIELIFKGESIQKVGQAFLVTLINGIEVATYRHDTYHGGTHTDCTVTLVEELVKDLERRDLTFNSMAFCPYTGDLIDPFDGKGDLAKGLVRFVGDPLHRIEEDPDRIVRACRFASNLGGKFEENTLHALREHGARVGKVTPERLRLEVKKALKTRWASRFFRNLEEIGILGHFFPSLKSCVGFDGGKHHGEDVFEHCMLVGDALPSRCWLTKLAGYLHDVGKPVSAVMDEQGRPASFIGHEHAGGELVEKDLRALKFSNQEISFITRLIRVHMRFMELETTPKAIRKLLARLSSLDMDYRTFVRFRLADRKGNKAKENRTFSEIKRFLNHIETEMFSRAGQQEFSLAMLAVNGTDLMREFNLEPGKVVGTTLKALFEKVLEDLDLNNRETLLNLAGEMLQRPRGGGTE
jgi:tRNA nucleotidyltransferase (CCA-adding enzyme)